MPRGRDGTGVYGTNLGGREEKKQGNGFKSVISIQDFEQALSLERFGRYLDLGRQATGRRLSSCTPSTPRLSEKPLHAPCRLLEVALRNRIHSVMTAGPARGLVS